MDRNEWSSPAFWAVREPAGLRVSVPVKSERFRSVLNLVWLLVWAGAEVVIGLFLWGAWTLPGVVPPGGLPLAGMFLAAFAVVDADPGLAEHEALRDELDLLLSAEAEAFLFKS